MNNTERIKEILNKEHFRGCDDVLMGDVLHYAIEEIDNIKIGYTGPKIILQHLKWDMKILSRLASESLEIEKKECSSALFLFSSSYGDRTDHRRTFKDVTGLFSQSSTCIYNKNAKRYSAWKFKYTPTIRQWRSNLKKDLADQPAIIQKYLLMRMVEAFCDYEDAAKVFGKDFNGIETLVVWCDVHASDSFFTQRFNAMGKKTVDLMHGSISIKNNPWTVLGVKSRYFIADSRYTKDLLENNGYKGEVIVCGYPYSISEKPLSDKKGKEAGTGVILSAAILHDDNRDLCRCFSSIREEVNDPEVKLHPSETKNDYPDGELDIFTSIYESDITSGDFLDRISYAVIAPSTVVYEAIKRRVPFLLYADSKGLYSQFEMPEEIIAGDSELKDKIKAMINGNYDAIYDSLIDYYTAKGNVKENYIKAFNSLGVY